MARQSHHSSELDQLFRIARRDIPSALEQRQLHTSVLAASRSGQSNLSDLLEPTVRRPWRGGKFALKLLSSLGVVAAIFVGAAQLRHPSAEPPATARLSPVTPGVAPSPLGAETHAPKSRDRTSNRAAELPSAAESAGVGASSDDRELPSSITTPTTPATTTTIGETATTTTTTADAVASANATDQRQASANSIDQGHTSANATEQHLATTNTTDQRLASAKAGTSASPKAPVSKAVPSEAALIDQAHRELANHPSAALALTEMHRKLYPKGILVQEREVIAIEALSRLGKTRTAEKRADEFRTEQPHSIHEMRLRGVLGDAGVGK